MGILEFLTTFVILGLDPRISVLKNFRIPYRDCPVKPDNDTRFEIPRSSRGMTENASRGIFIEILGSSPRMTQQGILDFKGFELAALFT